MGKKYAGAMFSSCRFGVRVSPVPIFCTTYPQHFLMPEISETLMGSFTKFFGTVTQTFFDGKLWYHLLCITFFDTPIFSKHWIDAYEIFWQSETKKFRQKDAIPLFSSTETFDSRILSKTVGFPYEAFRHCETKVFQRSLVISPSYA